jgi:hypothetical protein
LDGSELTVARDARRLGEAADALDLFDAGVERALAAGLDELQLRAALILAIDGRTGGLVASLAERDPGTLSGHPDDIPIRALGRFVVERVRDESGGFAWRVVDR